MNARLELALPSFLDGASELFPDDPLYPALKPIDFAVGTRLEIESVATPFEPIHVEPLLAEISQLLDRCLVNERTKHDLEARTIEFWLDEARYRALYAIEEEEIAAGSFGLAAEIATLDAEKYAAAAARLAEAEVPLVEAARARQRDHPLAQCRLEHAGELSFVLAPRAQVGDDARHHAVNLEQARLEYEKLNADAGLAVHLAALAQTHSDGAIARRRAEYEGQAVGFRVRRRAAIKDHRDARAELAQKPGSGINHREQLAHAQAIFDADWREAWLRILALAEGLRQVYGLDAEPPQLRESGSLSAAVVWVRSHINRLVRLRQAEIESVRTLSLRSLLGEARFDALLADGESVLDVPETLFPGCWLVRLRGISANLVAPGVEGAFESEWRVPEHGLVVLDGGTNTLDQSRIPAVSLGRVAVAGPGRVTDVFDGRALHNVSPVGRWTLRLGGTSTHGEGRGAIADVLLHLHHACVDARVASLSELLR